MWTFEDVATAKVIPHSMKKRPPGAKMVTKIVREIEFISGVGRYIL